MKSAIVALLLTCATAVAEPIAPGAITVTDGDTIRAYGRAIRLVGLDAPETGSRAKCEAERTFGNRAAMRLRPPMSAGGLDSEFVA